MVKPKSDPNIKTFPFVADWLDDILSGIDGYMDNKKLLVAVAIKRLYEDFSDTRKLNSAKKMIKFAESIIADVDEMKEKNIDVDVRLGARG